MDSNEIHTTYTCVCPCDYTYVCTPWLSKMHITYIGVHTYYKYCVMYVFLYVCVYVYSSTDLQGIPPEEALAFDIVSYIGCAVSLVCLILTVVFYLSQG